MVSSFLSLYERWFLPESTVLLADDSKSIYFDWIRSCKLRNFFGREHVFIYLTDIIFTVHKTSGLLLVL